ncbi:hypothetical protein EJB05_51583 [Eragrostis curvula]|uniref:Uncharacterized protein n=1 Tax=Eragrostis curvula TaxID=38414 RepID=A0A5J9SV54_9POAL|nr:hypothetical protein EJB05_51583 [Eragrostis curvula]
MASAEDAIGEAEAGSTKKNRRRISDYLGDSDGGELEASPPSPETPPQLRLPRFTCVRFRFVRLGRKRGGRKEVAAAARSEDASVDTSGTKQAETSTSNASAESSFGLSMLLLLARTCVELNRMAEVRAQMETLLNEIRDEAGRMKASADNVVGTPGTCCNLLQPSSTTVSSRCTSDTDTNRHATTSSCTEEIAPREGESKPTEKGELEAEHAQHRLLECNMEQETSESSDDEFIELDDGRFGGGSDLKWDVDVGDEDSDEESTGALDQDGGVCAIELERRLHELLHRRNRERIEELESALRRAEQKLMEKEMEARMWQDTATLALQPRDGQ